MLDIHTVSHLPEHQQTALRLIEACHKNLQTNLKLLAHLLKNSNHPCRVWALPKIRDESPAGATLYVGDTKPRAKNPARHLIFGAEAPQLPLFEIEVIEVGSAETAAAVTGIVAPRLSQERQARAVAIQLFGKLDRDRLQSPYVSDRAAGVICAPGREVRQAVEGVNQAKDALRAAVLGLKVSGPRKTDGDRHRLIADHIPAMRDIHLTQAYRKIPYIAHGVDRMTFGWARAMRQVQFRRIEDVIEELVVRNKLDGEGRIERQLLAEGVKYLARVEPIAPYPIVNYKKPPPPAGSSGPTKRQGVRQSAILPIILAQETLPELTPLPSFNPDPATWSRRYPRNAQKLEDQPVFVVANTNIAYYRYRPGVVPKPLMTDEE